MKYFTRGVITLELIIALALLALFITGAVLISFSGQYVAIDRSFLHERLYSLSAGLSIAEASTTLVSPCLLHLNRKEHSRNTTLWFETLAGDTLEAQKYGGGCDPFPPSDWLHAKQISEAGPLDAEGTGIEVRSQNGKTFAYVSTRSVDPLAPDLYVIEVTDPRHPLIVSTLNTGVGFNAIAVANDHVFGVQHSTTSQLQIISVVDPSAPTLRSSATLGNVNPLGSFPEGWRVAYFDDRIYVGTRETAGPEFHIYDVSNPGAPLALGRIEVTHTINGIAVSGAYAYLATSADYAELTIIDISNPSALTLPPSYSNVAINNKKFNAIALGGLASTEDGASVYVLGNELYLGRKRTNAADELDFYVLNISDPSSVTFQKGIRFALPSNTEISGVVVQESRAFLTTTSVKPLITLALDSNEINVQNLCDSTLTVAARDVAYHTNLIYSVHRTGTLLRIFNDEPSC